jgi:hypothetical protein
MVAVRPMLMAYMLLPAVSVGRRDDNSGREQAIRSCFTIISLRLSAPNDASAATGRTHIVGAVGTDNAGAVLPRSDPAIIHPRFAA